MTLAPPIKHVTPVQGNTCPKCADAIKHGRKRIYTTIGSCECTFPVPRMEPGIGYSRAQRDADLEYLEQLEQLECSAALANGLIGGWECQRREKRFARMRQKCMGLLLAIASEAEGVELAKKRSSPRREYDAT